MKGTGHCSFHRAVSNKYFDKVSAGTSINAKSNLLKHLILAGVFLIENYEQGSLRKELISAPLIV